jgi:ATP-dependent exoDNAse (exonuclease V) beta subunit
MVLKKIKLSFKTLPLPPMKTTTQKSAPFQVYNASAGAGKTYQLVQNYLELCLQGNNPDGYLPILAITFTNKAANEMKERLVSALQELAVYPQPKKAQGLAQNLSQKLNIHPQRLAHRAEATLTHILHHYSAFSISTIDSFTNRVIRSFSRDLKMSSHYQVELETDLLLKEGLDLLFERLDKESKTTQILKRFINRQLQEGKSAQAKSALFEMAKKALFNENALPFLKLLQGFTADDFLSTEKKLRQKQKDLEKNLSQQAQSLIDFMAVQEIPTAVFSRNFFPKWLNALVAQKIVWPSNSLQKQILGEDSFYPKSKAKLPGVANLEAHQETLRSLAQKLFTALSEGIEAYLIRDGLLANFYTLAVLAEVERCLQEVKAETNRLPISDFNKIISKHLREQPAPFIYEKIGSRYRHYFIDEFQDTSVLQWQNLQPLLENTLADQSGSLMIVGDAKQAIYRWRGGEVEQFIDLCKIPPQPQLPLEHRRLINLASNWRSAPEIVNFNNAFFTANAHRLYTHDKQAIYQKAQQLPEKKQTGYVQIQHLPHPKSDAALFEKNQCEASLKIIQEAQSRGYQPSQIAVLVRRNTEGQTIAHYLLEQGIKVVSPDSLRLSASPMVKAVISFFKMLHQPYHYPARIAWLEFLYEQLKPKTQIYTFLKEHATAPLSQEIAFYQKLWPGWNYQEYEQKNLAEKVYYLLQQVAPNFRNNAFMQRFLDLLDQFEQQESPSTAAFLRYWQEVGHRTAVDLPEGTEAVKIMTIHKSKGLEFPIVIYAFAEMSLKSDNSSQSWVHLPKGDAFAGLPVGLLSMSDSKAKAMPEAGLYRQWYSNYRATLQFDKLNMVYVAFTRAERELHILSSDQITSNNPETSLQGWLLNFAEAEHKPGGIWGKPTFWEEPKTTAGKSFSLEWPAQKAWEEALQVSDGAPKNWAENSENEAQAWGKKMHHLLAQLKNASTVNNVVNEAIRQGVFEDEEQAALLEKLQEIVEHPQLKAFYKPGLKVLNERAILAPGKPQQIPDRVVLDGNVAHVLDYKTGKAHPWHKKQVSQYQQLLTQMGYETGHQVLVYLSKPLKITMNW